MPTDLHNATNVEMWQFQELIVVTLYRLSELTVRRALGERRIIILMTFIPMSINFQLVYHNTPIQKQNMTIRRGKGNKHLLCIPEGQGSNLASTLSSVM
jgi:hypothetical protein